MLIPMDIKEQTLLVEGDNTVTFTGDNHWTAEAMINILKNCVEHTSVGGQVSISFSENPLLHRDKGKGIMGMASQRKISPISSDVFIKGKMREKIALESGLRWHTVSSPANRGISRSEVNKARGPSFISSFITRLVPDK